MQLSKRTQYGLRAAVRLARHYPGGDYAQSRDIAEAEQMPTKFLEQVLLVLRRHGLLESKVGSGGGYRLRRPPEQVTVAELLSVMEPARDAEPPLPPTLGGQAVRAVLQRLDTCRDEQVRGWTLADLLEDSSRQLDKDGAMFYI